jgi:hypothetical protein
MRWIYERTPDAPAKCRKDDPPVTPCVICKSPNIMFMQCETPGKVIGSRITTRFRYYVRCLNCGLHAFPKHDKHMAAMMWLAPYRS